MQLVAYLNGERVDATQMEHGPWRALPDNPGYEDLVLFECGLRAKRVTRLGRQFFAHWPEVACSVKHKGESDQHLAMKLALKERINATPGWSAQVECADAAREWIADVMAFDRIGRRVAFEVQLSAQNEDDYIGRSQRYFEAGIGPVWVVPKAPEWLTVKLPLIVTGFGKTSTLPPAPSELMDRHEFQPMFLDSMSVGAAVDHVLSSSFRWSHGTPEKQRQRYLAESEAARISAKKAAAAAEAARLKAEREAQPRDRAKDEHARMEAEESEAFVRSAVPASAVSSGVPAVTSGVRVSACVVRCRREGHPVLIWRLTDPPAPAPRPDRWRPRTENFVNVHRHVEAWLEAAGSSLGKGKFVPIKGKGNPLAFACPACSNIIQGRLVALLPPEKWSVIAHPDGRYVRPERVAQAWESLRLQRPDGRQPDRQHRKDAEPAQPKIAQESSQDFIGPGKKPFWMSEARDGKEIAERQAAKDQHAARMQSIRDNPRYRASPNGFRFECTDCGGMFEDDNEGLHADARCMERGAGKLGWCG